MKSSMSMKSNQFKYVRQYYKSLPCYALPRTITNGGLSIYLIGNPQTLTYVTAKKKGLGLLSALWNVAHLYETNRNRGIQCRALPF